MNLFKVLEIAVIPIVTSVIAVLISHTQARKEITWKFIYSEKEKWRTELKALSNEISEASMFTIGKSIEKLKLYIDITGQSKIGDDNEVFYDSHFWKEIKVLEQATNMNEFINSRKKIVLYISALLNYDNKETKRRAFKETLIKVYLCVLLIGFITVTFLHFYIFKLGFSSLYFQLVLTVLLYIPFVLTLIFSKTLRRNMLEYQNKIVSVLVKLSCLAFGIFLIKISYFTILQYYAIKSIKEMDAYNNVFLFISAILTFIVVFMCESINIYDNEYEKVIRDIESDYEKRESN